MGNSTANNLSSGMELSSTARTLTIRHLSSLGEGGGEGPGEGGRLQSLPGDALHYELQDLHFPVPEIPDRSQPHSRILSQAG